MKPGIKTTHNNPTTESEGAEVTPTTAAAPAQTMAEAAAKVAESRNYKECYTKWKPRWMLIPAEAAMRVTVDVGYVIQCMYGTLPEIEKHSEQLYSECPKLSPTLIQDLREATGGLGHCEMLKRGGGEPANGTVDDPIQAVRGIRSQLMFHGGPLVAKGFLTTEDLTASVGNSPRDLAFDVMKFVAKIGENFQHLEGKSMLTGEDLDNATKAAEDLLEFLGIKEKTVATAEERTLMRQRALTQVYELYEELRAGMRYARRKEKDFDSITPSIFTMRSKKASRGTEDEAETQANATTDEAAATTEQSNTTSSGVDLTQLQALMSGNGASTNPSATPAAAALSTPTPSGAGGAAR